MNTSAPATYKCIVDNYWDVQNGFISVQSPSGSKLHIFRKNFEILEQNNPDALTDEQYDTLCVLMSAKIGDTVFLKKEEMTGLLNLVKCFNQHAVTSNENYVPTSSKPVIPQSKANVVPPGAYSKTAPKAINTVDVNSRSCSCGCKKVRVRVHTGWTGYHCPKCGAGGSVQHNSAKRFAGPRRP